MGDSASRVAPDNEDPPVDPPTNTSSNKLNNANSPDEDTTLERGHAGAGEKEK